MVRVKIRARVRVRDRVRAGSPLARTCGSEGCARNANCSTRRSCARKGRVLQMKGARAAAKPWMKAGYFSSARCSEVGRAPLARGSRAVRMSCQGSGARLSLTALLRRARRLVECIADSAIFCAASASSMVRHPLPNLATSTSAARSSSRLVWLARRPAAKQSMATPCQSHRRSGGRTCSVKTRGVPACSAV